MAGYQQVTKLPARGGLDVTICKRCSEYGSVTGNCIHWSGCCPDYQCESGGNCLWSIWATSRVNQVQASQCLLWCVAKILWFICSWRFTYTGLHSLKRMLHKYFTHNFQVAKLTLVYFWVPLFLIVLFTCPFVRFSLKWLDWLNCWYKSSLTIFLFLFFVNSVVVVYLMCRVSIVSRKWTH